MEDEEATPLGKAAETKIKRTNDGGRQIQENKEKTGKVEEDGYQQNYEGGPVIVHTFQYEHKGEEFETSKLKAKKCTIMEKERICPIQEKGTNQPPQ